MSYYLQNQYIIIKLILRTEKLYDILKEYVQGNNFCCVIIYGSSVCVAEKKSDKLYWGNPQVYVTSNVQAAPLQAHFKLYDFKTNEMQPLDHELKNMNVMGELRYEVSLCSVKLPML